jgi:hypothetical protein
MVTNLCWIQVPGVGLEVVLKVLSFPDVTERKLSQTAYVSSSTHQQLCGAGYVELAKGSDCVLTTRCATSAAAGALALKVCQTGRTDVRTLLLHRVKQRTE